MGSFSCGIRATAAWVFAVTVLFSDSYIKSEQPDRELRCALRELNCWLESRRADAGWRKELRTDRLEAQLEKGLQADPTVLSEILRRFALRAPETDRPRFVRVRRGLEKWLASLPPPPIGRLSGAARAAKANFVPRTQADVLAAESDLRAAVGRLETWLDGADEEATRWRAYLDWDLLNGELSREGGPDLTALDAIYAKYAAGEEGLDLAWFKDVRNGLRSYLTTARAAGDPDLQGRYHALLDALPEYLEAYRRNPTAERAAALGSAVEWLEEAGQAKWLLTGIRHHYVRPNLFGQVSADLIAAGFDQSVDEMEPVRDVILGARVYGTGHTTGRISVELIPSTTRAEICNVFHGVVQSDTTAYKGPARVYTDGTTGLTVRKTIVLAAEGFSALPARADATTRTTIRGVSAGRGGFIQKAACKRAYRQKCAAEMVAASHAERRANRRADEQARELLDEAQEGFARKFRQPLIDRRLFPQKLRFTTSSSALHVTALQVGPYDLAASDSPPPTIQEPDLAVQVHESMINNLAKSAYAGVILREERFRRGLEEVFESVPERFLPEDETEPWAITFARQQPISVAFAENQFTVTIRGRRYTRGENDYPGMNVTAVYQIQKTAQGSRAVRQGDLQIFPPGFTPGTGRRLSVRQQIIRDLLQRRFGRIFEEVIVPEDLALPGRWSESGKLAMAQWEIRDGWMVVAWNRTPAGEATAVSSLTR